MIMRFRERWYGPELLLAAAAVLCVVAITDAQPSASRSEFNTAPTLQDIEAKKAAVEDDSQLVDTSKAKALDLYERAAAVVLETDKVEAQAEALDKRIESAPERITALRQQLAEPPFPREAVEWSPDAPLAQLLKRADEKRVALRLGREVLTQRAESFAQLQNAGRMLSAQVVDLERQLRKLAEEQNASSLPEEPVVLTEARQAFLAADQRLKMATLGMIRRRFTNYDLLVELEAVEQDGAATEIIRLESEAKEIDAIVQGRRQAEASQARVKAEALRAATVSLPGPVAQLAEQNVNLRVELEALASQESDTSDRLQAAQQQASTLETELTAMRKRVEIIGPSKAMGRLLRRRFESLPTSQDDQQLARNRRVEISRATDRHIDIEELQRGLADVEPSVSRVMSSLGPEISSLGTDPMRLKVKNLLTATRNTLAALHQAYGRHLARLIALDAAEQQLAFAVNESVDFIHAQLLWIQSLPPIALDDASGLPQALGWLVSSQDWARVLQNARQAFGGHRMRSSVVLLVLMGIFYWRRHAPSRLAELAEKTRRIRTDAFTHTVLALVYTLVAASAWPLLLTVLAWHLGSDLISSRYSAMVGDGLFVAAKYLLVFNLLHWIVRSNGLADRHFRWSRLVCEALTRQGRWLGIVVIPVVYVSVVVTVHNSPSYVRSLGRPALLLGLLALTVFIWQFFKRSSPFITQMCQDRPTSWPVTFFWLWFPVLLAVPIVLMVISALGYHDTAILLTRLLAFDTGSLFIGLLLLRELLLRRFTVIERRLRFEAAVQQRQEARAQREKPPVPTETEGVVYEVEEPEVNYEELGNQVRTVIRAGMWLGVILSIGLLWGELLPTLGTLDRVDLPLTQIKLIDGIEQHLPVTLLDLGLALFILVVALFAAKNLSGLLVFTFFERFRPAPGSIYALVTLGQYSIVAIGMVMAFSKLGLQWSKLQWLVAALGVGLGFGLQEIVANFVSGIVLLLERPIRVGDTVTVGDASGKVARIRIRATTIITWEHKELVVPNKEFITGRLLNWTLSDPQTRLIINVGIAYGSNVASALKLLEETAQENEHVLADPKPLVTFEGFGDNSLNLVLRCYVPSIEYRLVTITALHTSIYRKYAEAGIVIAFPQSDVHLDISQPLEIKVVGTNRIPENLEHTLGDGRLDG